MLKSKRKWRSSFSAKIMIVKRVRSMQRKAQLKSYPSIIFTNSVNFVLRTLREVFWECNKWSMFSKLNSKLGLKNRRTKI